MFADEMGLLGCDAVFPSVQDLGAFAFKAKQFKVTACTFKIKGLQSFKISEILLQ